MAIKIDGLADAVADALREYREDLTEEVKASVKSSAKACVAELKTTSPKRFGRYSRSWRLKHAFESTTSLRIRVYNKDHYRLTHLLEDGHANVTGGRTSAQPHIQPAADKAAKLLQKDVEMRVGKK